MTGTGSGLFQACPRRWQPGRSGSHRAGCARSLKVILSSWLSGLAGWERAAGDTYFTPHGTVALELLAWRIYFKVLLG